MAFWVFQYVHCTFYTQKPVSGLATSSLYVCSSIFWVFSACFRSYFAPLDFACKQDCSRCGPCSNSLLQLSLLCFLQRTSSPVFKRGSFLCFQRCFLCLFQFCLGCYQVAFLSCRYIEISCHFVSTFTAVFTPGSFSPHLAWINKATIMAMHVFQCIFTPSKVWTMSCDGHLCTAWVMHPFCQKFNY